MNDYHLTSSVNEMIDKLKWNNLDHYKDIIRLQMMYKIIHQIVNLTFNWGITRGHDYKLKMPLVRIDSCKFSFFTAIIALWNQLYT